jgi:hypothetical protein
MSPLPAKNPTKTRRKLLGPGNLGQPLVLALLTMMAACAEDPAADPQQPAPPLMCAPGSQRACPCPGAGPGTGMQSCDPTGRSYGACTGCPPPQASPMQTPPVAGGVAAPIAGAGAGGAIAPDVTDGGMAGSDASMQSDGSAPTLDQGGAVAGTSCGVGLPSLCAKDSEKCCVRSLATDTCIAADAACECELPGCTVMEAHCDGPEDCADGEVCCGTLASNGAGYESFMCAAQCMSSGSQRVACHADATECPGNDICANSQLLTNVQVCIDPATIEQ